MRVCHDITLAVAPPFAKAQVKVGSGHGNHARSEEMLQCSNSYLQWAEPARKVAYAFQFAPAPYNVLSSYTEAITMNSNIYLDDATGQLNRMADMPLFEMSRVRRKPPIEGPLA
jgi:hypothetical protein